ncbi:MAG: type IV secretion system DNA-binding domain-containing protein [Candidatus Saccharibacteria bacterium]|nr:type IV secretion system DNA-binding domain-containing protein [Candidatus Saccharibacteria bacterium]
MSSDRNQSINHQESVTTHTLLMIKVPRTNDQKELSAEQMFAALHGILKDKRGLFNKIEQEHISFEIASIKKNIYFYIWLPAHLRHFVEGQVYAQYPTAQILVAEEDYVHYEDSLKQQVLHMVELGLTSNENIPIKTFPNFEVDPLSGITAALARLEDTEEEIWIQIIARPIADDWHKKGYKYIEKIKKNNALNFSELLKAPFQTPQENNGIKDLTERERARIQAIEDKNAKLGYKVKIRLAYLGKDKMIASLRMQAIIGAFKQFNTTELNGFVQKFATFDHRYLIKYKHRDFPQNEGFILNIEELASVFHLPHTSVSTPNIVWASAKTAEPPSNLPTLHNTPENELSCFGVTNFRNSNTVFGSLRSDRGRHTYVLGQTGTGKTGLLELLALADINHNQGYAIVDPHGDFALNNLNNISKSRIKDVVYFNPADADYPIGFNPLEILDERLKVNIASDLVGVMKKMFDSWGPRLEYILRYTILALLDNPGSTMLDITSMLTNKNFRKKILGNVQDVVVLNFWRKEFDTWDNRFQAEAVAPVLNKVGAFTANPIIRNIIGQPKGSFNIRQIMDEGKILILNLSRGLIGEDNASILGAMIITKIQLAAISRADISIDERRPFYLYVDEFQNFATDSFAVILSEARKYKLHLTLANQYISQMPEEVSSAVFGNVGTIVSFRVSPEDAPFLEKYFTPQFDSGDIIQLANRDFVTTMTVAGEKIPAFSGRSLELPEENHNNLDQIIENSRTMYGIDKAIVEKEINKYHQISTDIPLNENSRSSNKNRNNKSKKQKNKILEQKKQD